MYLLKLLSGMYC